MSLYAKRSPWPFHCVINGTGFLIGSAKPGDPALVSVSTQSIDQVAPPDYSYAGANPTQDREEPFQQLTLGMGLAIQEKWDDQRYSSANAVDLSVLPWCLGPEINTTTPAGVDATNGITRFFEIIADLYCANGANVYKRGAGDTWTLVHTFAAPIIDVCVFTSQYDGVQRAFFALRGNNVAGYTDGLTWHTMPTFTALAFTVIAKEFWWADSINRLRKLDTGADPTNEANYTSLIFHAGDLSSVITSLLVTSGGTLIVAKTDGCYTLDASGQDKELFPFLRYADLPNNGRAWGVFENGLYVAYGNALGRIDPDLTWTSVGPDDLASNTASVSGAVTAFAGVETMFAYSALLDKDTNTSYLCKFGAWVSMGVRGPRQSTLVTALGSQGTGEPVHIDAWHGSVSIPFPNRAIQTLFVSSIGSVVNHTRTYIGFSDGSIGWIQNACTPNPAGCSQYRYFVGDGYVDLPIWHAGYHASYKSLRHFSVTGAKLDANDYVTLDYRLDPQPATPWTPLGHLFTNGTYERVQFPITAYCTLGTFRVHLHNTDHTSSPLVMGVSIGHALRPLRIMEFQAVILCADGLVRRDGVPVRMGRTQIQKLIEAVVDTPGAVNVTLPDETQQQLAFTDYSMEQSFDEIGRQWRGSLKVKAVQWL